MIDLSSFSGHCLGGLLDVSVKILALALMASVWLAMGWARSAALRHAVWATVLCGMLGLPLLSLVIPGIVLPVLPASTGPTTAIEATVRMAPEKLSVGVALPAEARFEGNSYWPADHVTWTVAAFGGYLAGVVVLLARLFVGLAGCRRIVRASRPIAVDGLLANRSPSLVRLLHRHRVQVRVCSKVRVPLTLGWWRPKILLPAEPQGWGSAKREAVLAHVERRDALFVLLGAITQCLYWFHPLAWLVPRRLASLSERVCDDRAIALTGAPVPYARCLLEFAETMVDHRSRVALGTVSMTISDDDVGRRIEAVLDHRRAISPPLTRRAALLLMTLAVVIVPILAALRAGPRAPEKAVHPVEALAFFAWANAGDRHDYVGRVRYPEGEPAAGLPVDIVGISRAPETDTDAEQPAQTKAKSVRAEPELVLQGRTAYDPDRIMKIRARFNATVEKVHVSVGQTVKKGDAIVDLFSKELATAKNDLQTGFIQWQHDLSLVKSRDALFERKAIARQLLVDARNDENKSRLAFVTVRQKLVVFGVPEQQIDSLIANVANLPQQPQFVADKAKARIRRISPIDGLVIQRSANPGAVYNPNDVLLVVVSLDQFCVWADVPSGHSGKIIEGQECEVDVGLPGRKIPARVDIVSLAKGPGNKTSRARIRTTIPNLDGQLRSDLLVRVRIRPTTPDTKASIWIALE